MCKQETVFSFDIGWAFHGWGVKVKDIDIDTGVYAFEHYDDYEQYAEIRRSKKRSQSKKRRLNQLKKMFVDVGLASSTKEIGNKLKKASHQNKIWLNLQKAHIEKITPEEFMQILYRFAKRRHYVDMRKKEEPTQDSVKKKEEGEIKKSLSKIAEIYENLQYKNDEVKTWFSALFKRREELIKIFEEHAILIDREKFPYTNASLKKIIGTEKYKQVDKKIIGYELLLKNEQIAEFIETIAKKHSYQPF